MNVRFARFLYSIIVVLFVCTSVSANTFSGQVTGDLGDTKEVLHNSKPERILFHGIDYTQRHRAYGTKAGRRYAPGKGGLEAPGVAAKAAKREIRADPAPVPPRKVQRRVKRHKTSPGGVRGQTTSPARSRTTYTGVLRQQGRVPLDSDWSESDPIVYITLTDMKYHSDECKHLKGSKTPIKMSEAKARGYVACEICKPELTNNE